jgi:hypothetical protein
MEALVTDSHLMKIHKKFTQEVSIKTEEIPPHLLRNIDFSSTTSPEMPSRVATAIPPLEGRTAETVPPVAELSGVGEEIPDSTGLAWMLRLIPPGFESFLSLSVPARMIYFQIAISVGRQLGLPPATFVIGLTNIPNVVDPERARFQKPQALSHRDVLPTPPTDAKSEYITIEL